MSCDNSSERRPTTATSCTWSGNNHAWMRRCMPGTQPGISGIATKRAASGRDARAE